MKPYILHNICNDTDPKGTDANYNTRSEVAALPKDVLITFDGIYRNVWENRDLLINRNIILFITGAYIGTGNHFDMPAWIVAKRQWHYEKFCDWNQIMELVDMGCKLGWHSQTHRNLTLIKNDVELAWEVKAPFLMEFFAYPYEVYDQRLINIVKAAGYKKAYSVRRGNDSAFQITRRFIRKL